MGADQNSIYLSVITPLIFVLTILTQHLLLFTFVPNQSQLYLDLLACEPGVVRVRL